MAAVRLRILGLRRLTDRSLEAGVFCEAGILHVGDKLVVASDPTGNNHQVDLEVLEIRFFDHLLDELEEVFSANVVFAVSAGTKIEEGWILEAA
jgi:hypothetical protein